MMLKNKFDCKIYFSGKKKSYLNISSLKISSPDGGFSVWANHQPMFYKLKLSVIEMIRDSKDPKVITINEGVLYVNDNEVIVIG